MPCNKASLICNLIYYFKRLTSIRFCSQEIVLFKMQIQHNKKWFSTKKKDVQGPIYIWVCFLWGFLICYFLFSPSFPLNIKISSISSSSLKFYISGSTFFCFFTVQTSKRIKKKKNCNTVPYCINNISLMHIK